MKALFLSFGLCVPVAAFAQDTAAFDAGLGECARYVSAKLTTVWASQVAPLSVDEDEGGIDATVVYPQGSGAGFDFAVSFAHDRGTSTSPGTWTCSGSGPKAPQWPAFNATGWISADARLRANGLVELKFPPPQRAYANCGADAPDIYVLFNAGDGDRVVFAATTGPAAAAFCTAMGWKG